MCCCQQVEILRIKRGSGWPGCEIIRIGYGERAAETDRTGLMHVGQFDLFACLAPWDRAGDLFSSRGQARSAARFREEDAENARRGS